MSSERRLVELDEDEWRGREQAHRERVEPWIAPRQARRSTGRKHPVDDFLFDYYPYSANKLATWHPGAEVLLLGAAESFLAMPAYRRAGHGVTVDTTRLSTKADRLGFACALLKTTAHRTPQWGCFGLHEWAMVYRLGPADVRHAHHPLRLSPDDIADVVDGLGLRCTHIDAYRFFTPQAVPLNACEPTRESQSDVEQPGCLHANMDLYKYAMWFSPFIGSDLAADCFELAREARQLDMQAAPYDLLDLGYEPIRIETPEGRQEYVGQQRVVAERAALIRWRLLAEVEHLQAQVTASAE